MYNIYEAPFVKEMCDITANMYRMGWDERNGGSISYRLKEEEVKAYLDAARVQRTLPSDFDASYIRGEYFIVTGTGRYFKKIE